MHVDWFWLMFTVIPSGTSRIRHEVESLPFLESLSFINRIWPFSILGYQRIGEHNLLGTSWRWSAHRGEGCLAAPSTSDVMPCRPCRPCFHCVDRAPRHWRALIHVDESLWSDRAFMLNAIRCRWQCAQLLGCGLCLFCIPGVYL